MAKILITGLANSGKTSLLQTLEKVFVVAMDGKKYPFPQPHINVDEFENIGELITLVEKTLDKYEEKYKTLPSTIAFDSVSRIFSTIVDNCEKNYKGFDVWSNVNKEILSFTKYVESISSSGINVVLIAHCIYDEKAGRYTEVAQGNFAKIGGFLSVVDYALNIEATKLGRTIYHKDSYHLSRSLLPDIADKEPVKDFNLQIYIDMINKNTNSVDSFSL